MNTPPTSLTKYSIRELRSLATSAACAASAVLPCELIGGLRYVCTRMPTGARRTWVLCPRCDRRCFHLYLEQPGLLACRLCYGLRYKCQTRRRNKDWGAWGSKIQRLAKLRAQIKTYGLSHARREELRLEERMLAEEVLQAIEQRFGGMIGSEANRPSPR